MKEEVKMEINQNKVLNESLFKNLLYFFKTYNRTISENSLIEGFPLKADESIPDLFSIYKEEPLLISLASKGGFKSKILDKKFEEINPLLLPAIAILKNNTTIIIEKIDLENKKIFVLNEDIIDIKDELDFSTFKEVYADKIIILKKDYFESEVETYTLNHDNSHWFFGSVMKNLGTYKDIIICSILINIFVLFSPFYVMNIYDRVVPNFAQETLWAMSIGVFIIYVFDFVVKFFRAYYIDIVSKKIDLVVSSKIFDKILNMKLSHKPKYTGSFANNVKDFEQIKSFFSSSTIAVLVDLPFVILFLVAIMYISGLIVLVPILFIVLILLYSIIIKKPLFKSIESSNEAISHKNGILIESLNALETIKSLGASGHLRWKWEETTADISKKALLTKMLSTSISNVNGFLVQFSTVAVVVVGVYQIASHNLTLGGLIAAVILSSRAIVPMGQFASLISSYEQAKASFMMLDKIMKLPDEKEENKVSIHKKQINGDIKFRNVNFFYNENKKILNNISFEIKQGEKVAIIGKMGSGKSTILKLLMKLYDSNEGEIIVDGVELKQIETADVRKNLAYVSQEAILFNGTLKENILYKHPNADDKILLEATKKAQLLDFINAHPLGFDLNVGERGDTLSGGQKKAISLARAIVGNYTTLLLDEPTDSMDSMTESRMINDLKDEILNKTLILITHKNSMLQLVDRIIVMDEGNIIIDGPKEQVLNQLIGRKNEK